MLIDSAAGTDSQRRIWIAALFMLGVMVGTILRLSQLSDQIVADDEWHALHALLAHDYKTIFTHFGICDHCIPLTLYYKFVADTVGLSEWGMRAPVLLAGIATLILTPWLLVEHLGVKCSLIFQWLLAVSPLHVFFSRFARPYSLAFFLVVIGMLAFARWWRGGKPGWAVVFAICAILTPWLHLAYLPFALAPLGCVIVLAFLRARREASSTKSVWSRDARHGFGLLGAVVILGWCALLAPPLIADWTAIAGRSGAQRFELPDPLQVAELISGAQRPLLAFACGLVFLLGLIKMLERQRAVLLVFAIVLGAQIAGLSLSGPDQIDFAVVLVRYSLPMLAIYAWICAVGLDHFDRLIVKQWKRAPAHLATISICAALPWFGPLRQKYHEPNNWTNHAMFQSGYTMRFERDFAKTLTDLRNIPPIYADIGEIEDEDCVLVDAPWRYEWPQIPYPVHQYLHRKRTLIGFVEDPTSPTGPGELPLQDGRFDFENFVHVSDFVELRRKKVRFVLFHRDPRFGSPDDSHSRAFAAERQRKSYVERFGAPMYEDERLSVFDLRANP